MSKPVIAVLQGDGVGPELLDQSLKTLNVICSALSLPCEIATFPCGAEYWQKHREEWPSEAKEFCTKEADAILFGSVGLPGVELPTGDLAGVGVVFFLRQGLDLYASVRPVELLTEVPGAPYTPNQVHLHLVREATEGLYSRIGGILTRGQTSELAVDVRMITARGTKRVSRFAFELADGLRLAGDSRPVTCIDKSNVLEGCRLFRHTVRTVAEEFPEVKLRFAYVDNFALEVLKHPQDYSVCLTSNAFGDILADLLAFHEGGTGMAATGNFGNTKAMFEPLHGPQSAMKGKGTMNPVAIHRCLVMLLAWLARKQNPSGFTRASKELMAAIRTVLSTGTLRPPDLGGVSSTSEMCHAIREALLRSIARKDKEASE
jgi:isocitrate/isopropylmalate dehydrogenase